MRTKFYRPVSGIPRGVGPPNKNRTTPYSTAGRFHSRTDLLYSPAWGKRREQHVSRSEYPEGSTHVWGNDANLVFPLKDSYQNERLYKMNEQRYIAPALRAQSPGIQHYIMNQLDPGGRSGIGQFNVRWSPETDILHKKRGTDPLTEDEVDSLPDTLPKHLIGLVNELDPQTLTRMLKHTMPRQKMGLLWSIVKQMPNHSAPFSKVGNRINPFPILEESKLIMRNVHQSDLMTMNRKLRDSSRKSPMWRKRELVLSKQSKEYKFRKAQIEFDAKAHLMRNAARRLASSK